MFELIFAVSVAAYCLQLIALMIGASRKFPKAAAGAVPSATVIVAARNEESNILTCMESLERLEYPDGKLEIIIVDDNSTDRTGEIIDTFITGRPAFRKVNAAAETAGKRGKSNALAQAVKLASGEIILTTDADCIVRPGWAKALASYYTPDVGVVNGFTHQSVSSSFHGMQSLDFLYLLLAASGTINTGFPISCIGNNMSYRKSAYLEAGGYEGLPFCITEDSQLLLAIARLKKYKTIYPLDPESLVTSKPCGTLSELCRQKRRWAIGGLQVPFYSLFLLGNAWFSALLMLPALFSFSPNIGALIFFRLLLDYTAISLTARGLKLDKVMKYFWAFEIYLTLYVVILPFTVLFSRRVKWKGRAF